MQKVILTLILLTSISIQGNAQTLKEKLAAKKAELAAKLNTVSSVDTLDASISQDQITANWSDGKYTRYSFNGSECMQNGDEIELKFIKEDGKVVAVTYDGAEYRRDHEGVCEFIRYYKSPGNLCLVFSETWVYVFAYDHNESSIGGKYFIKRRLDYAYSQTISRYLEKSKENQAEELAAQDKKNADIAAKKAAEDKAKWSIEGKNVTKIEITDIKAPYSFGYYRSFSFEILATLSNGKTISTKDGGYWSDYEISYENADVKNNTIQDTKFVKDDKVIVTVKSRYDSKIVASSDVVMDYSESLTMNNNSNNWGESAANYTVEVKQMPHAVTGEPILLFKVTDHSGYQKDLYFKMDASKTLNFNANGHNGYKTAGTGNQTGPGANAGNGGNITVYKDPSVTLFDINYSNRGGTGGAGTAGYNRGADGRDGKFKEEVRTVKF